MPRAVVNEAGLPGGKIEVEYETFGSSDDPAILLIMGLGAQLTLWPDEFCQALADSGRHVIRFDNRDCGLSTKLDGVDLDFGAVMFAVLSDQPDLLPPVPYTLSDMATDSVGLLDHLGIESAHIVGASMGGMIAQTIAIEHPSRIRTLVSIMSTTGEPALSRPTPETAAALLVPPPTDRQSFIDTSEIYMVYMSKKYGDVREVRERAARDYDRSFAPKGVMRQLSAAYASGSRAELLGGLTVPTLVIHGRDDTLLPPAAGLRTAELIPGSVLMLVGDMGHDLPRPLIPLFVDAIISHTNR